MNQFLRHSLAAAATLLAGASYALTLTDANTSIEVDSATGVMSGWTVDGDAVALFAGAYFLRVGAGVNTPVHLLPGVTTTVSMLAPNIAQVVHENAEVEVRHLITLTGGPIGSITADVAEGVRVRNKTAQALPIALFQYNDFDLDGAGDDYAELIAPDYICQYDLASPKKPRVDQTITGLMPAIWKIGGFPSLITYIDGTTNDLDNQVSPFGPGDATYAFQMSGVLSPMGQPSSSMVIGSDKVYEAVPEPASMAAIGIGLVGLLARRRK